MAKKTRELGPTFPCRFPFIALSFSKHFRPPPPPPPSTCPRSSCRFPVLRRCAGSPTFRKCSKTREAPRVAVRRYATEEVRRRRAASGRVDPVKRKEVLKSRRRVRSLSVRALAVALSLSRARPGTSGSVSSKPCREGGAEGREADPWLFWAVEVCFEFGTATVSHSSHSRECV